jgi:hypothetical protein
MELTLACFAVLAVMVAFVVCEYFWSKRRRQSFNQRFPPITDAEFVERCGPGTNPEIALRVRRIVSEQLNVEYERIYPESSFADDLGAE